ncbi:MAG: exonuclease domain-containing protein [Pyrinomonadaceae bacterium]
MQTFRNLVPDSTLVQEAIQHLRINGGRAPVVELADTVLQLPNLDPHIAALIVGELIKDDWRLRITDTSHEVELTCEDDERRDLSGTDYVVFDVETTGPKTPPSRIIEIGAYRVSRGRIVGEFQTLVNPQARIPPFIVGLTGITDEMVADAPVFSEIAADWLRFADTAVLVAHNASFDVRFINHEVGQVFPGRRMFNPHLCTVSLSRRIVPEISSHRLHSLAEHFAITIKNRHRAAGDALATAEVFLLMLDMLHRHGVRDLSQARRFRVQTPNINN